MVANRNEAADLAKLADAFFANLERETRMEYGGWGLDDKRPFGNSSVQCDILEIIGWEPVSDDYYSNEQEEYADKIYDKLGKYLRSEWKRLKTQDSNTLASSGTTLQGGP